MKMGLNKNELPKLNRFSNIEKHLLAVSKTLGVELIGDRVDAFSKIEERRINWIGKDNIQRSITIQPTFESGGIDTTRWNFLTVAWKWEDSTPHRKTNFKDWIYQADFSEIEAQIEELLTLAVHYLNEISYKDLK